MGRKPEATASRQTPELGTWGANDPPLVEMTGISSSTTAEHQRILYALLL